jgi:hypothetical protein
MGFTFSTARGAFDAVNVTGRIQDAWLTPQAWRMHHSPREPFLTDYKTHYNKTATALNNSFAKPLKPQVPCIAWPHYAAANKAAFAYFVDFALRVQRLALPLHVMGTSSCSVRALPVAAATMAAGEVSGSLALHATGWPILEAVIGRGQTRGDIPRTDTSTYMRAADSLSQWGIAGFLIEKAPLALSDAAHASGRHQAASACLWAATFGRVLLQLPRAAVAAIALTQVIACAALGVATLHVLWAAVELSAATVNGVAYLTGRCCDPVLQLQQQARQCVASGPSWFSQTDIGLGAPANRSGRDTENSDTDSATSSETTLYPDSSTDSDSGCEEYTSSADETDSDGGYESWSDME